MSLPKKIYFSSLLISVLFSTSYLQGFRYIPNIPGKIYKYASSYFKSPQEFPKDSDVDTKSSKEICEALSYIKKRKPLEKKAQDRFTETDLFKHHKIGISCSGGGYRAMISALGFIIAANKIGLLDASTFTSTLSGSTWTIGTMLTRHALSPYEQKNSFLDQFRQTLQEHTCKQFWNLTNLHWLDIFKHLGKKLAKYKKITPDDIWGAILADRLLGDLEHAGQNLSFETIRTFLDKTAIYPFPLFSAIIKDAFDPKNKCEIIKHAFYATIKDAFDAVIKDGFDIKRESKIIKDACKAMVKDLCVVGEYEWLEVSPFHAGSDYLGGFIPEKYFGSGYKNGKMTKLRPEECLAFYLALFGSPFDFNLGDLILQITQMIPEDFPCKKQILNAVHLAIMIPHLTRKNFLPSKINNPTYKMGKSKLSNIELITLADAGFDFNIAVPPLLYKETGIILCCDDSTDSCKNGFPELKLAKRYADQRKLPFPSIKHYEKIDENVFVFKWDENKKTCEKIPTIIYFGNPISHSTFKLTYSKEEFNQLCDYMLNKVIRVKKAIAQEIIERDRGIATENIAKRIASFSSQTKTDNIAEQVARKIVLSFDT